MSEAAEETESHSGGGGPTPPAGGGNKLVMIVTIVNMVATLGIAAVLFMSHSKEASQPKIEDIAAGAEKKKAHAAKKDDGHGGGHGGGHGDAGATAETHVDAGKMLQLDPFTVNLASGVGSMPRYVRMNISVELEEGAADEEFKVKTPRVRDTVISLLNSKKATDIGSPEGRELLKDELKRAINGYMQTSKVKGVYFTNFAVSN